MRCRSCGKDLVEGTTVCPFCFTKFLESPSEDVTSADEDFAEQFNRATVLWKNNLGDLALFTFVFMIVGWIPLLNAAFFAGYSRGLINLTRGRRPRIGNIFSAWDSFGNTLVYQILLVAAMTLACFIPFFGHIAQFAVAVFGTPGLFLVIDRNINAIDAVKWSVESVQRHFIPWLLIVLVGGVIGSIGLFVFVIGAIVTIPWGILLIIQQYEAVKGEVTR